MTICVSYCDSKADGKVCKFYDARPWKPGLKMLKQGVFPGEHGFPDLHIIHLRQDLPGGDHLIIVCLTDHATDEAERERIVADGIEFLARGEVR